MQYGQRLPPGLGTCLPIDRGQDVARFLFEERGFHEKQAEVEREPEISLSWR